VDQFKAHGATVIGVTAGNTDQLADFSKNTETCGGKFPVAADEGAKIAAKYDATLAEKPGWSDRTSYVITPQGTVAHAYSDRSPKQHVQETLDAVKALEHTGH
jgi:peroxiredoxin